MTDIKEKIRAYAKSLNIEYTGFTRRNDMSCIVFLFPYYTKIEEESNISLYCRSLDYHIIIKDYLTRISNYIYEEFNIKASPFTDIDPDNEVEMAIDCNLGVLGKNRLLINKEYGSFVFIGVLKTVTEIEPDVKKGGACLSCNKCIDMCRALKENDFNLCASEISQKKGDLSENELSILKWSGLAFGCDKCQTVCPMNTYKPTPIKDFYKDRCAFVSMEMLDNMSNRKFMEKYKNRAFSWRGRNVLTRNLSLLDHDIPLK